MADGFHLLIGAAGSGKTHTLLERAKAAMQDGKRVWWVGLPSQRAYVYRRATENGALLGLEFLSSQQVYYRLLARALRLKPLVVGTGRIALVGEALKQLRNELPSPGEASLFTRAIAECKRYGLKPESIETGKKKNEGVADAEIERFKKTFRLYERIKGDRWDYDDFRSEALKLALEGAAEPEADIVMVDGFREISPLEYRLYKSLGEVCELWLSLPELPSDIHGATVLEVEERERTTLERYRAPNPVSEARWVLRSLKRDLASGFDALDLAVVLPPHNRKAFLSLADEYGVPIMDEAPKALADTPAGKGLLDLLELPDYPTASKLLALPELAPLANAALERGIAGREALSVLAREMGLNQPWVTWLNRLEVPESELEWARDLVESLPELYNSGSNWETLKGHILERAKEASSLAKGASFRAWWAALLQETFLLERPRGGVALLDSKLVSGRRFKRLYLMHAVEGAYTVGEDEDYFVPEEARKLLPETFRKPYLPKRFLGRDRLLFGELLTRADSVTVTYPEADQGGVLVRELDLTGKLLPSRLSPEVPAGSRLEVTQNLPYKPTVGSIPLGSVTVGALQRYDDCAFRFWGEKHLEQSEKPWWQHLRESLWDYRKLNAARLEVLKKDYPQAALWLHEQGESLTDLSFGVNLPDRSDGVRARVDAAGRSGTAVRLYTFVESGQVNTPEEARDFFEERWSELWAVGYLLETYTGRINSVQLLVWPVLGSPIEAFEEGIRSLSHSHARRQRRVQRAYARFAEGDVSPQPGYVCRGCSVYDVCREGKR